MLIAMRQMLRCTRILIHARPVPALIHHKAALLLTIATHRSDSKLSKTRQIDAPRIAFQRPKSIGPIRFLVPLFGV